MERGEGGIYLYNVYSEWKFTLGSWHFSPSVYNNNLLKHNNDTKNNNDAKDADSSGI